MRFGRTQVIFTSDIRESYNRFMTEQFSREEWLKIDLFTRLHRSRFRMRFTLKEADLTYIEEKGMEVIRTHAEEIVRNLPAGVVVASRNKAAAEHIQDVFMSEKFRIYTQDDMLGVEIAGAVKNVIAIATGISDGMKLGSNARAALMTRAMHEIIRLGTAMGADKDTFAGLSGIGDLIVTCSTNLSRNRRCGLLIGLGLDAEEAVRRVGSVVEGYYTAEGVCELAEKYHVEMPISNVTYKIIKGELAPEKALNMLMLRDKKDEIR